jgi:TetR/AcrR family transcriptional regulator
MTKVSTRSSGEGRLSAQERREEIIRAAIVEFAAHGYHGASTERIANEAGISQPYVFRLFGTKKELFCISVDRVADLIKIAIDTAVAAEPQDPMAAVSRAFTELMHRRDELVLLLQAFASVKDPDLMDLARNGLAQIYAYVAELTGKNEDELQRFFAHGMLLVIAATLDLPSIAEDQAWAANLIKPRPHL